MRYEKDLNGLRDILLGEEMYAELERHAEVAANYARANAPVGKAPPDPHPGQYRDSVTVERAKSFKGTRAAVHVVADVPYAAAVEAKHHTLSTALDVAKGA